MYTRRVVLIVLSAVLVAAVPAGALELGDAAPALEVAKWVKGDPVELKAGQGKNIYVIEFWATWCGPCIRGIPHLTELQKKYKDKGLVIVSISSSDDNLRVVEEFVKKAGDKMGYTIAYEDRSAPKTAKAYMDGFGKKGIPQCFLVDKHGKIVWEGHPLGGLEEVIEAVLTDKYDVQSLAAISRRIEEENMKLRTLADDYLKAALQSDNQPRVAELGEKLLAQKPTDAELLNYLAWTILTDDMIATRDAQFALRIAKLANDLTNGESPEIVDTYARALFDTGSVTEAVSQQRKAVELARSKGHEKLIRELEKTLREYEAALKKQGVAGT